MEPGVRAVGSFAGVWGGRLVFEAVGKVDVVSKADMERDSGTASSERRRACAGRGVKGKRSAGTRGDKWLVVVERVLGLRSEGLDLVLERRSSEEIV